MQDNPLNLNHRSIVPILLNQLNRYPLMFIEDIYKLIHQAVMGPEHFISDKGRAFLRLRLEFDQIDISFSRPLWEEIDPLGQLIRLNLVPFKKRNGDLKKLFEFFYQTSVSFKAEPKNIIHYFNEIMSLSNENKITYNIYNLKSFFQIMKSQGFSAVHHSVKYRNTYHPAYRLIAKNLLPELQ